MVKGFSQHRLHQSKQKQQKSFDYGPKLIRAAAKLSINCKLQGSLDDGMHGVKRSFLGDFLRLSKLIFFVNYFCLQHKLSILIALSFWFELEIRF